MTDAWRLWRLMVGAQVRAQMQYRTSLMIEASTGFAVTFLDFIAVLVLFQHIHALGTWSLPQVAFLYGLSGVGFALADLVIGHIEDLSELIRSGRFDVLLLRPVGTLLQVVASDLAIRRLGKMFQAAIVLGWAISQLDIAWSLTRVAMCFVAIGCAAAIFASIWIAGACIQFFALGAGEIANAFTYGGNFASQYPVSIYGPWVRRFVAYLVPIAFVAYFPALAILDRPDPLALPHWLRYASPIVAGAALGVAMAIWQVSVRHYRSTGS